VDFLPDLIAILVTYKKVVLTAHLLGVVLGLGAATVGDILLMRFLKDFRISQKEADVMYIVSWIVIPALLLLFISGVALFLTDMPRYGGSAPFMLKMTMVAVLTINGILLHLFIMPKMIHISFRGDKAPKTLRRAAFMMGAISATSWYATFFVSMLKSMMPGDLTYISLLTAYIVLLVAAVTVSQGVERRIYHMANPKA
jgi:hypothetical protein